MHLHSSALSLVLALTLAGGLAAAEPTPPPATKLFAVTFTTGPGWDASKPFNEQKFAKEHSANLARLRSESFAVLGGRYADKGLVIVRATDEAAVRAQLAQDPSLAAGTFQVTVDEYRPFYHGTTAPPATAATPAKDAATPAVKLKQFMYVLRLVPRLHDDSAWTDADKAVTGRHFAHLTAATKAGQVILAGRTMEPGAKTFGVVIFEAADESAARSFMNSDPAIGEKIMTAELHPYAVALQRK